MCWSFWNDVRYAAASLRWPDTFKFFHHEAHVPVFGKLSCLTFCHQPTKTNLSILHRIHIFFKKAIFGQFTLTESKGIKSVHLWVTISTGHILLAWNGGTGRGLQRASVFKTHAWISIVSSSIFILEKNVTLGVSVSAFQLIWS